jgi:hypothetical protein
MMSERDQSEAPGRGKKDRNDESKPRDDAERQPESGYADGHLDTRPSTDQRDEERRIAELETAGVASALGQGDAQTGNNPSERSLCLTGKHVATRHEAE